MEREIASAMLDSLGLRWISDCDAKDSDKDADNVAGSQIITLNTDVIDTGDKCDFAASVTEGLDTDLIASNQADDTTESQIITFHTDVTDTGNELEFVGSQTEELNTDVVASNEAGDITKSQIVTLNTDVIDTVNEGYDFNVSHTMHTEEFNTDIIVANNETDDITESQNIALEVVIPTNDETVTHNIVDNSNLEVPNNFEENGIRSVQVDENNNSISGVVCAICNKSFTIKGNLKRHVIRKHSVSSEIQCSICGKLCASKSELKEHSSSHSKCEFKCSFCEKVFNSRSGLRYHLRQHENMYKFICQFCGKGYNEKTVFEGHVSKHNNQKLNKCDKCQKSFRYFRNMKTHYKVCGEKKGQYMCKICGGLFKQNAYLQEHLKAHDNPERFQCSQCGNRYKHRASLYKHIKMSSHK